MAYWTRCDTPTGDTSSLPRNSDGDTRGTASNVGAVIPVVGDHDEGGGAIGHDGGQPGLGIGNREGNEDGSDPEAGKGSHDEIDGIRQEKGDPISLLDPPSLHSGAEACRLLAHLAVGELTIEVLDGRLIRSGAGLIDERVKHVGGVQRSDWVPRRSLPGS